MDGIVQELIQKYFRSKKSIILAIFIGIILGIVTCLSIPNIIWKIIAFICIVGIVVFYIIDTIGYNRLPKNKINDAVLVRIIAKDKIEYDDIKYKFGNEFNKFLSSSKINILYIPYHLIAQNDFMEKEKIINLLKRTNCIFLTTVKTRSEEIKDNTKYITEFNLGIMHPIYVERIERLFQNEVNILGMPTSRIKYEKDNKLEVLEVTAHKISLACQYIIARAYYLSSDFEGAINIGETLYNELNELSETNFENIRKMTRTLCYETHIMKMLKEYSKNIKNIEDIERELNEANKYEHGTYLYYEGMSVCSFLKNRDIRKTKEYLGQCKSIKEKGPWKYSEAFIKAYCGESEGKIIYQYKQAFKIPYEHMELISFIEDILEKEPEKNMLRFALMLLYLKIGETKTAKSILQEYLEKAQAATLEDSTINQLKKIYDEKIIEELIKAED